MSDDVSATSVGSYIFTKILDDIYAVGKSSIAGLLNKFRDENELRSFFREIGAKYSISLNNRFRYIKIIGMSDPVTLRQIYVRVTILTKVTSRQRVSLAYLESTFDRDRAPFGQRGGTYDGTQLISHSYFRCNDDFVAHIAKILERGRYDKNQVTTVIQKVKKLELPAVFGASNFRQALSEIAKDLPDLTVDSALLAKCEEPPRNYVILGKPGAGKTTFLKSLALFALDGDSEKRRIPIYISLKSFSDSERAPDQERWLLDFILTELRSLDLPADESIIVSLLSNGKCLLLLDGLDEVSGAMQDLVLNAIVRFSNKYNKCQFIASCRIAAYNYLLNNFHDVEIADFAGIQIETFVHNWFYGEDKVANECLAKIRATRQIAEMASNPLLLTLLCISYNKTLDFPQNRAELYSEAVEALLKTWDSSRRIKRDEIYKRLSPKRKETMLSIIAKATFEKEQYFVKQETLEELIVSFLDNLARDERESPEVDGEAILKSIEAQHGFFVERAQGIFSFSHLTFQEYFTAKYIVDNGVSGAVKLMERGIVEARWREVFLMASGLFNDASEFITVMADCIKRLMSRPPLSEVLVEIRNVLQKKEGFNTPAMRIIGLLLMVDFVCRRLTEYKLKCAYEGCIAKLSELLKHFEPSCDEGGALLDRVRRIGEEVGLRAAFADDKNLHLRRATKTRRGLPLHFPINEIGDAVNANVLLVSCVNSDCYTSKQTRAKVLSGIFLV